MSALPAAFVDIWPSDGGAIHFSSLNGGLLSVSTFKDIWDPSTGSFELLLPPGGPYGPNVSPQWVDIITPMSLTVIGLQRSVFGEPRANIVMAGVVTVVQQDIVWRTGAGVQRACRVTGQDFSYFFNQQSAYCSMLIRYAQAGVLGPQAALAENGIVSGSPDELAKTFYNKIMAGTSGIMSGTKFNYFGGQLSFSDLVQTDFRAYPGVPIQIPIAWNYLALEGPWNEHFKAMFPFPWYEFFVQTESASGGTQLSIGDIPYFFPAGPVVTARPLPIPKLTSNGTAIDRSLWDELSIAVPDGNAVIVQQEHFDVGGVKNFYVFNPQFLNTMLGGSNQTNAPWMFLYASWIDVNSIQKYGYKPCVHNVAWLCDPQGNQAQQNAGNTDQFTDMVGQLALVPVGFYEPYPLMANGSATLNLRPDIVPGVRFEYIPDKAGTVWQAYIRAVGHTFVFGEPSTTTLTFTRGLPVDVYEDNDLLLSIMQGKGARVDGLFTTGTGKGIEVFNINNAQADLQSLSTAFNSPGAV